MGSIQFTAEVGQTYVKGDELGFFAFGGSTCIAIFQKDSVVVDEDIVSNRSAPLTLLKPDPSLLQSAATQPCDEGRHQQRFRPIQLNSKLIQVPRCGFGSQAWLVPERGRHHQQARLSSKLHSCLCWSCYKTMLEHEWGRLLHHSAIDWPSLLALNTAKLIRTTVCLRL